VIDGLAPITQSLAGARLPQQATVPWLSIVPVAQSRSSYNGLLLFAFIAVSTLAAVEIIHRFASRALRRGPAWDCGFPDSSPALQYTADSFAQPIRRVFGEVVFLARERVDMPLPGETRSAHITVSVRDLVWEALYAPLGSAVAFAAEKLTRLQFLTVRQYLSLVFAALIALLFVLMLSMLVWS
jgi:hypothetical protein